MNGVVIRNFMDVPVSVTPTLDTNAYASGDLLFDSTVVQVLSAKDSSVPAGRGLRGRVVSVSLNDKDDQGAAVTLYLVKSEVDFGTLNSAPSISDGNVSEVFGKVDIAAADWKDLGGARFADAHNLNIPFSLSAGTRAFYVAGVTGGTPTHTASGLVITLTVEVQES